MVRKEISKNQEGDQDIELVVVEVPEQEEEAVSVVEMLVEAHQIPLQVLLCQVEGVQLGVEEEVEVAEEAVEGEVDINRFQRHSLCQRYFNIMFLYEKSFF